MFASVTKAPLVVRRALVLAVMASTVISPDSTFSPANFVATEDVAHGVVRDFVVVLIAPAAGSHRIVHRDNLTATDTGVTWHYAKTASAA